jgi:hypothetical protein
MRAAFILAGLSLVAAPVLAATKGKLGFALGTKNADGELSTS